MLKNTPSKFTPYVVMNDLVKTVKTWLRERKEVRTWIKSGRPAPPPHTVKQRIIKHFLQMFSAQVFVETGTYRGDMVRAVSSSVKKIYSIELDEQLYRNAAQRFLKEPHIEIVCGDSAQKLPSILDRIHEPALFWLDGHFSGEATAKGELDTPILQELRSIFAHRIKSHTILIDDARLFVGKNDYPSLEQLKKYVLDNRPDLLLEVESDIIRIYADVTATAGSHDSREKKRDA